MPGISRSSFHCTTLKSAVRAFCIVALSAIIIACTVNPVTGEKEFSLISPQQEVAIGVENYAPSQQAQGGRYYIDPEIQVYVSEVGRKLAAVSDRPDLPYEFVVLNNRVPNAWALPGGKIAVNSGLLVHLDSEAELAAVLGHEIVHAAARHSAAQMTRGAFIGLGAQALGIAGQQYGLGQLAGTAAQIGAAAWMARYGRDDELESDAYGMDYMVRAGYDPNGAVTLQETFVELSKDRQSDFISGLFASHPPSQTRVDANRKKAAALPRGTQGRDRYQRMIAQLKKDAPAYKAQEDAIKALKAKDAKTALQHLDKAKSIQPRDSYTWELRGYSWNMMENSGNAIQSFSTAIRHNPDYFSPYLSRGILHYEDKQYSAAEKDLRRSYDLLPTEPAAFYLGELSADAGNETDAMKYYQVASQGSGNLAKQAQGKLAVLELAENPSKYIRSGLSLSKDKYLQVTVQNASPVEVRDVQIRVSKMLNMFTEGEAQIINGPDRLGAGRQVTIKTRIGPFQDVDDARKYAARVVGAKVAD
ncbi:MAG: M48 family metalloprotease [bacterium]